MAAECDCSPLAASLKKAMDKVGGLSEKQRAALLLALKDATALEYTLKDATITAGRVHQYQRFAGENRRVRMVIGGGWVVPIASKESGKQVPALQLGAAYLTAELSE